MPSPMLFFLRTKNYLSNQMHTVFSENKNNIGDITCPMMPPIIGGVGNIQHPHDAPHVIFFLRTKIIFPIKCIVLFLRTKITWGCHAALHDAPIMGCQGHQTPHDTPMLFFDNLEKKNWTVAGVLRKNIWFSLPVPKIKFDPTPQGKYALMFTFQVLH